jgi:hypothetical protein
VNASRIIMATSAAVAASVIAGCGGSGHPAASTSKTTATTTPAATASAGSSSAAADEQALANALAASIITVPPQLVSGPIMTTYITYEHELTAAYAASGNPSPAQTVSVIAGGYQLCQSGTSQCQDFTGFSADATGQVTAAAVDGQPIAGRIAAGGDASGNGLQLSGVTGYRVTSPAGLTAVCFTVDDMSFQPPNNNPAVLATLDTAGGQVSADETYISLLPASLSAGVTAAGCAVFATTGLAGAFSLVPNDQTGQVLVSSTLSVVGG